jgi:ribosomal protein S18 acetylase RimI-like enzyme
LNGIDALQRNTVGLLHLLGNYYPNSHCWEEDGLLISEMGWTAAQFNGVFVLDPAALTAERLDEVGAIFDEHGYPFGIDVCSDTPLPDCDDLMREHGYTAGIREPIMVCEGPLKLPLLNPDIQIRVLDGPDDAEYYKQVMMAAFEMPRYIPSDFFNVMLNLRESFQLLAWLDGEAVGSGMLLSVNGSASIYNVATIPSARRKGVATAMMAALHRRALDDGYEGTVLVVQSREAQTLYRHLGYRHDGFRSTYERY